MTDLQENNTSPGLVLKKYFGYEEFRPGQREIIDEIMGGRDILSVMPTGAGKSICYQVPALAMEGITIVISPLISLMQDQVKALNDAGVYAAYINSSLTERQIHKVLEYAAAGKYKIIYVAPERLGSQDFLSFSLRADISMVTVDEAHCISQWGQDFRPAYLEIPHYVSSLSKRPVVSAFTATATPQVREDVLAVLGLKDPFTYVMGFDRENLYFEVERPGNKDGFLLDFLKSHSGESGIIYCATRKNTDSVFEKLFKEGVSVLEYHAGLSADVRKRNQERFIYDEVQVMVATNAFGMGIDKSNVRFVIHYNMPQSMENYYQEAGRAGRDGEPARCILLFSPQDVIINKFLLEKKEMSPDEVENEDTLRQQDLKRLNQMEAYCRSTGCLRNYILKYFGEQPHDACGHCGNCDRTFKTRDMTDEAKWVINAIAECKSRFGLSIVTGILRGANRARLKEMGAQSFKSYGKLDYLSEQQLRDLIDEMIALSYIRKTDGKYPIIQLLDYTPLKDENTRVLVKYIEEEPKTKKKKKAAASDRLTSAGYLLFDELRALRMEIAREESLPPYIVFSDRTLIDMCVKLPQNSETMYSVSGVGQNKYEKYGERFIAKISEYLQSHQGETFSIDLEEDHAPPKPQKRSNRKPPFVMNESDAERYVYDEYCYASEIAKRLNEASTVEGVKKASYKDVWAFLEEEGLIHVIEENGKEKRMPTQKGTETGIILVEKTSKDGETYKLVQYPKKVQEMVVAKYSGRR